jgi:periplasmic copper chaperone A
VTSRFRGSCRTAALSALALIGVLVVASTASAHARISPAVSLSKELQLYSLAVPTEKENASTTSIELTVPKGFSIDSFVPSPGWQRKIQATGSGEDAVVTKVTWTGGKVPTEEDSLFQFLAQPASSGTYTFQVRQTYSDGSIVNWTDPESGENPAPAIEAKSSLGGGGVSVLTIVALIAGILGILLGGFAVVSRGGGDKKRTLA